MALLQTEAPKQERNPVGFYLKWRQTFFPFKTILVWIERGCGGERTTKTINIPQVLVVQARLFQQVRVHKGKGPAYVYNLLGFGGLWPLAHD
jgi:hypothetical protein